MTDQLCPTSATRTVLEIDGHALAARQCGPLDGPPVLLLPGYTGSKEDFAPVLDPIAGAGYRVTALDLPGQYESPGLPVPADHSPAALAPIICTLAAQLGPGVRLLGHSYGGLVARAAVVAAPARFASLVLLSSGPAEIGGQRRLRIESLGPVLAQSGLAAVYAAMQSAAVGEPGYVAPHPGLGEFLERRFLAGSPAMLQGMGDALRTEPDRVDELAAVDIPVLVVHGARDDAWPPAVQCEMAVRLDAQYRVVPDAAHSPAVENPAGTLDALLPFWTSGIRDVAPNALAVDRTGDLPT